MNVGALNVGMLRASNPGGSRKCGKQRAWGDAFSDLWQWQDLGANSSEVWQGKDFGMGQVETLERWDVLTLKRWEEARSGGSRKESQEGRVGAPSSNDRIAR